MLDYKIIASGSKGNAVRIENLMIDCGITFDRMKDELYKVDALFVTHIHGDHLKKATLKKIMQMFPNIKVYGNYEVAYEFPEIKAVGDDYEFEVGELKCTTFPCVHDVTTQGLFIKKGDLDIIYATDTAELPKVDKKFDYLFIESNYDEKKLENADVSITRFNNYLNSSTRHLSTQKSKLYFLQHRKDTKAKWIELHKSERFY